MSNETLKALEQAIYKLWLEGGDDHEKNQIKKMGKMGFRVDYIVCIYYCENEKII